MEMARMDSTDRCRRRRRAWFLAWVLLGAPLAASPPESPGESALRAARAARRSESYVEPSADELALAERLFALLLRRGGRPEAAGEIDDLVRRLGLEIALVPLSARPGPTPGVAAGPAGPACAPTDSLKESSKENDIIIVTEAPGQARGWGVYAFRSGPSAPQLVQAPHAETDLGTGRLLERFFLEGRAAAAAWSSAPRRARVAPSRGGGGAAAWSTASRRARVAPSRGEADGAERGAPEPEAPADLAHAERSLFQALTRAFASVHPRGLVIQLHGFDRSARASAAAAAADAIVSAGALPPPAWLVRLDRALDEALGPEFTVLEFPDEVSELGATRNAQGRLLSELSRAGFLHVELSLSFRRELAADTALRRRFWACVPEEVP
jgi:hypothetical protein